MDMKEIKQIKQIKWNSVCFGYFGGIALKIIQNRKSEVKKTGNYANVTAFALDIYLIDMP